MNHISGKYFIQEENVSFDLKFNVNKHLTNTHL